MVGSTGLLVDEDLHRCRGAWRRLIVAFLSRWERDAAEPVRDRLIISLSGFQDGLRRGVAIGRAVGVDDHVFRATRLGLPAKVGARYRKGEIRREWASWADTQNMGARPGGLSLP